MPANVENKLRSGDRLSHYEIEKLLGAGGMGEVYLAHDTKLDRKVAIKILNQSLEANSSNVARFIQEAKAASALNHPNILVIHEIGETKAAHYIVSEFIEGKTLREILQENTLNLAGILDISIQIANALTAAHAAHIVHRDIKPENIIVRPDGFVKILDFGLAKLVGHLPIGFEETTIRQNETAKGIIMGTVSYMSPEQAKGEKVDARTDIFSLGGLIYEMIAGRTPFAGDSMSETFANLINKEPRPLAHFAQNVPDELQRVVSKMLQKKADERYQTIRDALLVLKDLTETLRFEEKRVRSQSPDDHPTAILHATTGDANKQTAEVSHKRSFPAKRKYVIGAIVFGSLVFAFLFYQMSGSGWPGSNSVVRPPLSTSGNSPAYDYYLRGKVKVGSDNRDEVEGAIKLLEQAVTIDPSYAEAYAALAQAYNTKSFQFAPETERKQLNENAEVAVEKALALNPNLPEGHFARGIILWTHAKRFPHEQAIQSFKRAIALNPNLDEAHHRLAMVYSHIGLLDEAQKEVAKALEINPNNTMARFRVGTFDAYQGKYEEAVAVFKTIPRDVSPSLVDRNMADALVHLGRFEEANALVEDYLKTYPQDEGGNVTSVKALLLAKAGREKEAEEMIKRAIEIGRGFGHFHHTAYNIASAYALMNQPEQAIKWLQDAADDGFPNYPYFELDANLNNIRKHQRFSDFMTTLKPQWLRFKELARRDGY